MDTLYNELFPFLERFIKKGKVKFPGQGVTIVEGKLEDLLLLTEKLEELGIPLRDCLSEICPGGDIMSEPVRLYIFPEGKAKIVPVKPVSER